jgi:hypothetical protein
MRGTRIVATVLALTLVVAGYLTLRGLNLLTARDLGEVKAVAAGDQEIAWIDAATSGDAWERLVAALHNLEDTWQKVHPDRPALKVDYSRAFLDLTADTPEISLWAGDASPRLWLRWYKVSGEAHSQSWIEKLTRRPTPPLAVIGGATSDRALRLARLLRDVRERWPGHAPLFLITTATADRYAPPEKPEPDPDLADTNWPKLMDVYKDRSFRFSFANTRMAEAVMDFVQNHPDLWTEGDSDPSCGLVAALTPSPLHNLAVLAADRVLLHYALYTFSWNDDRYSLDLSDRFMTVFNKLFAARSLIDKVDYSVGDFYQPNPSEVYAVDRFLLERAQTPSRRQLLGLPTGAQPARRFLRTLVRRAPLDARKLVVLTGDSINFNTIYRDRDIAWNVLEMPVPLVLFSHRNPVDESAGFRLEADPGQPASTTGTQDLLLHRDLMEAVIEGAFPGGRLLQDADELNRRLRESRWKKGRIFANEPPNTAEGGGIPLFEPDGDRHSRTGEHIVWLRPLWDAQQTLPRAVITVWRLKSDDRSSGWRQVREHPMLVDYESGR